MAQAYRLNAVWYRIRSVTKVRMLSGSSHIKHPESLLTLCFAGVCGSLRWHSIWHSPRRVKVPRFESGSATAQRAPGSPILHRDPNPPPPKEKPRRPRNGNYRQQPRCRRGAFVELRFRPPLQGLLQYTVVQNMRLRRLRHPLRFDTRQVRKATTHGKRNTRTRPPGNRSRKV